MVSTLIYCDTELFVSNIQIIELSEGLRKAGCVIRVEITDSSQVGIGLGVAEGAEAVFLLAR